MNRRSFFRSMLGVAAVPVAVVIGARSGVTADLRGADAEAVQRLEQMIKQIDGSIESRAVSAVRDAINRRGRA